MRGFQKVPWFFISLVIISIAIIGAAIRQCSTVMSEPSQVIGQGEVASVEYLQGNWSASTKTVIHFKDGSAVILYRMQSIPPGMITVFRGPNGYEIKRGVK